MPLTIKHFAFAAALSAAAFTSTGCHPKYPSCKNDSQCHTGEFCVNGTCQQCRSDADCHEGQGCNSGACEDVAGYCSASHPCPAGQECQGSRCVAAPGECDDARPCPGGQACEAGRCVEATAGGCELEGVRFSFDSYELDESARAKLSADRQCATDRGIASVHVVGHADPRGTEEYNLALGDRRAQATRTYLESLGVTQVSASSRGEEDARGEDESSWLGDRRADVVVR